MIRFPEGNAIVYCQNAFNTTNGKTAHGLIRFSQRYHILSVIDSCYAGKDSGEVLDGKINGIPVHASLKTALEHARFQKKNATHFVIGLAPDGGRLDHKTKLVIEKAIHAGLHIDCGLHDYLTEDRRLAELARKYKVQLRDIRKPPPVKSLHFFSGKIEEVSCLKIAVLGTDSAIGKRTTARLLVNALKKAGYKTEMIGTGQTAWMQGARYGIVLDSLVNDFVAGEIEHAVWSAWKGQQPQVVVIEGQGSLMNPAYPGGFEILAAGRPDIIILQHAPARKDYDGFPGYRIQPLTRQIQAVELISGKKVKAITLNREGLTLKQVPLALKKIQGETGLPAFDVLNNGALELAEMMVPNIRAQKEKSGDSLIFSDAEMY